VTWSYQLLTDEERQLFDQCAVFAGSFDLDAVDAICTTIDSVDEIASLVDKSMVVCDRSAEGTRYRLLETMRQYAEEQLDERELGADLRDRRTAYCSQLMHRVDEQYDGPEEANALATFDREWDNVRAAVAWADATGELERRSTLLVATTNFAVN